MLRPWNWLGVAVLVGVFVIGEKVNMGAVNVTSTGSSTVTSKASMELHLHLNPFESIRVTTVTSTTVIPQLPTIVIAPVPAVATVTRCDCDPTKPIRILLIKGG